MQLDKTSQPKQKVQYKISFQQSQSSFSLSHIQSQLIFLNFILS